MKRFKVFISTLMVSVFGTKAAFADAADPGVIDIIESDSDVQIILIVAVVVIIVAVILLRRSIKKRRAGTERNGLK